MSGLDVKEKKKALEMEKDLYEYQKNIANQTKNIATLEKQLASLQGDTSEEGRAKIQKIQVRGQEFFRMGSFVLKSLFDSMEYGHYCHDYDPNEIDEQLAY